MRKKISEEARKKMRDNHADFSGKNNPMFGKKRPSQTGKLGYGQKNGIAIYRREALEKYGCQCDMCEEIDETNLIVHHKDRNRKNNKIKNLQVLCKNCHLIEHFKGGFWH